MKLKYHYKKEKITKELLEKDKYIQVFMKKWGYKKLGDGEYISTEETIDPVETLTALYWELTKKQWFVKNVDVFSLWYDSDNKEECNIMRKIDRFINEE